MTTLTHNPAVVEPEQDPSVRAPLVLPGHDAGGVADDVAGIVEGRTPPWWLPAVLICGSVASLSLVMVAYLVITGVGVWGLNQPVGWAWDITNFVFWIGIGHAGTLISAILFLLRQKWRTSINRAAEAMTIFAVTCAGLFPLIHVGRVWRIYFTAPIPNHLAIWPNFRSPLLWDVFAVSTYATISLLFWYVGLIPDLASLRDRAAAKGQRVRQFAYGLFALGWVGGQRQWRHYEMAYLLLAGLSTPLVLSVHSIVSFDFAVSQVPGWHTTIFPPYFVAGAIFGGFAMVITLLVPLRALFGLHHLITDRHLDNMCKIVLATGMMVGYAYLMEFFIAWYSAQPFESFVFFSSRMFGDYAWAYWSMIGCNVVMPQLFWFRTVRRTPLLMFGVVMFVNAGMWFERFVIIVTSLYRDSLPSSWGHFSPTWVDILTFVGTIGLFLTLMLLFVRFLPMIAASEVKGVMDHAAHPSGAGARDDAAGDATAPATRAPPVESAGVLAEFDSPDALLTAAKKVRLAGYRRFDVFTPYPVHHMDAAMGLRRSPLGFFVAAGAVVGGATGYLLQWYPSVVEYPLITGGKPYHSWPLFMPITFELAVLVAGFAAVFGMFALNGLPQWYHPALKHPKYLGRSDRGFFLVIETRDAKFDATQTPAFLRRIGGCGVALLEA